MSFLSSSYNPGWRPNVKSFLFEILLPLDSARALNFPLAYVAYTGIKAVIWLYDSQYIRNKMETSQDTM